MLKKLNLLCPIILLFNYSSINTVHVCPKDKSIQVCGCKGDPCDQMACCIGGCDPETKTCVDGCKKTTRGCKSTGECCPGYECNGYCAISTKKPATPAPTATAAKPTTPAPVTAKAVVAHKK